MIERCPERAIWDNIESCIMLRKVVSVFFRHTYSKQIKIRLQGLKQNLEL